MLGWRPLEPSPGQGADDIVEILELARGEGKPIGAAPAVLTWPMQHTVL